MGKLLTEYERRVQSQALQSDPAQAEAANLLDQLSLALDKKPGLFSKPKPPKGLYLWGGVGRGKSMLMDLFFEHASEKKKLRTHFHDFMLETHAFIGAWRKKDQAERRRHPAHVRGAGDDPIPPAANRIANEARLLCFDEFFVTDIADAMILGRLFEQLWARGVVIVATSNRHPQDLYKNGLNRQLFLPFIAMIEANADIFELRAARDYRLERLTAAPVYYSPLDADADTAMDAAWARLTESAPLIQETLTVQGRELSIEKCAAGCARFGFSELCDRPLGAADYLTLARRYHTVFLDHVPKLTPANRNAAKRFVTLIDALYEARTKLVVSAEAEPDDLYPAGDGAFEFERTASRLHEMRSNDYLAAERIDENEDA